MKFSPAGETVRLAACRDGGWVRVTVSDHGPGIAPAFRARLFEKFAQGDSSDTRKFGGTGLGLSIAKAIVEAHGGRIGFTDADPAGTTFFVELPVEEGRS